jgi:hypothetical protein
MKKHILFLALLAGIFAGCQVDKTGVPQLSNNTTLNGTWYLKSEVIDSFSNNTANTPDTITSFTTNDFYKFNTDNTVVYATTAAPAPITSYYSLLTNAGIQTLTIGSPAGGAGYPYTVNKLTKDSLILYNTTTSVNTGITYTSYTTNYYTR